MGARVITVGRQYGSNGRRVAKALADRLGVHFYDKELIKLASERSEIPYEELVKVDEQRANPWRYPVDEAAQMESRFRFYPMNDVLYDMEVKIIEELAHKEDCVIVGRCSNYILKDYENCTSIFIYAPMEARTRTIMDRAAIGQKDAQALIHKVDKQRRYYYNYFTDRNWEDMEEYHICLDSSRYDVETSAAVLENMWKAIYITQM